MGRRPQPPKEHRPSPLQQVELTRPISVLPPSQVVPELGLVRDPAFWKRFTVAVHKAEETDSEMGLKTPASSVDIKYG